MMQGRWSNMSAVDLGQAIGQGAINAVELAEYFLAQIDAHPQGARIYARSTPARARGEALAAAARAKAGLRRGPLDGVPISWKDNFDSAGIATEAGSALLANRVPQGDARVLAHATLGGLVCLGKTHMSELAFSGLGLNPVTATPPCVNDPQAVAGGSSSGAAASVAFGLAPAAMGTDTGGSVRVPAAWNDLVGLKTPQGSLPMQGVVPLCARFDSLGPIARNVADCAALWAAVAGEAPVDLRLNTPPRGGALAEVRLAVLRDLALDDLRDAPAQGFQDALARLARAGARLTDLPFPAMAEAMALAAQLFSPEAWATWRHLIEPAPHKMFAPVLARFRAGADVLAADYLAAWARLEQIRALWLQATTGYDAVLLPTSPILPPNAARLLAEPAYFAAENLLALRNTRIGNLMGGAAITLPTSVPSAGVSLMAQDTGKLLRLAHLCQGALA